MTRLNSRKLLRDAPFAPVLALIYCRVSSKKQETEGDGLVSQETRCREYAAAKGYQVVEVFHDTISGSSRNRPKMAALISHLRVNKKQGPFVVLIDNQNRIARDVVTHWHIRETLKKAGGILQSPTQQFGESSQDRFMETVLAAGAQLQREGNADQTRDRMRARVQNGYWPFAAPVGFRHVRVEEFKGKILVRKEPLASIVQEALEGYAAGRFRLQAEVQRFLAGFAAFPKNQRGIVRLQQVKDILSNPIYAGYVSAPKWDVPLTKGVHEGLINLKTHERILQRLDGNSYAAARADINVDFPLRGAIACAECGNSMTGYWSAPKTQRRYPYYMCFTNGCARRRKSVRRETVEREFEALLEKMSPSRTMFEAVTEMFRDVWGQRTAQASAIAKDSRREAGKVQTEIDAVVTRLIEATSPAVISALENRVTTLERRKLALLEDATVRAQPTKTFEELFESALKFLSNPSKVWKFGPFENKKVVLRLGFCERLQYAVPGGFRIPETSFPFKVLQSFAEGKGELVRPRGFEPLLPP